MCGIFGRIGDLARDGAEAAIRVLGHRGPDGQGVWRSPEAELGHTRLAIVDLRPEASQPMTNEDGTVVVAFNGEIYNFAELRPDLEARGHRFKSRSDTEVIVHLYEELGVDCVARLDGMFALAIYDSKRRRLVIARDRPGKKPLFYAHAPGRGLAFASEIKALIAAGLPAEPDEEALAALLVYGYVPPPATSYRGIQQLPPASVLVYDLESHRLDIQRYWSVRFSDEPKPRFDRREAAQQLRGLVEGAVRRRLVADVPIGAFLSGGLDSTVVVGLMARHTSEPVRTFSIGMAGDPRYDETHYARIAARAFSTRHTEFVLEPTSFDLVEKMVYHHDGPFGDSSAIPTYVVSKLTRDHVTVALTGDGGDEVFGGYTRFITGMWSERVPGLVWDLGARLSALLPKGTDRTLTARAARFFKAARRPLADRLLSWQTFFAFDPEIARAESPARRVWEQALDFQRDLFRAGPRATPLGRILDHNFKSYLPYDLLVKTDRTSMAVSLEARCPLLDTRLIEFCAALPDEAKVSGVTTKALFREAYKDLIPTEIMNRSKAGFGIPLGTWLRGPLREYLVDRLGPSARLYQYLEPRRVQHYLDEHFAQRADHGHQLWLLLTLEVWLRQLASS